MKKKSNKLYTALMSFIFTFFTTYFLWTIFFILDEANYLTLDIRSNISLGVTLILLLAIVVLYFIFEDKLLKKFKLDKLTYNLVLFPTWCILNYSLTLFFAKLISKEAIHYCDLTEVDLFFGTCHLNGIEYSLYGYISILVIILLLLIKLIKLFIQTIKISEN